MDSEKAIEVVIRLEEVNPVESKTTPGQLRSSMNIGRRMTVTAIGTGVQPYSPETGLQSHPPEVPKQYRKPGLLARSAGRGL